MPFAASMPAVPQAPHVTLCQRKAGCCYCAVQEETTSLQAIAAATVQTREHAGFVQTGYL